MLTLERRQAYAVASRWEGAGDTCLPADEQGLYPSCPLQAALLASHRLARNLGGHIGRPELLLLVLELPILGCGSAGLHAPVDTCCTRR
jgi:hypothetical protein